MKIFLFPTPIIINLVSKVNYVTEQLSSAVHTELIQVATA